MKKLVVFILFLPLYSFVFAQPAKSYNKPSDFDSTISRGINQIYNIDFAGAEITFKGLIANYPVKPQGRFFLAMIDWWKILMDPDKESYDDIFFQKLEDVIYQCDGILDKDPDNVDALFFKGGSIGFRGRLRAFRDSWIKAADDGRLALPIVEHAYKIDPKNIDVLLGFGIYDYYAAVIPDQFPLVRPLMIFFPPGDKKKGIEELTNVALHGKYAKYESRYFLMTLNFSYDDNPFKAEEWAKMLTNDFPNNPIFERWRGRIAAKSGDYFDANEIFKDVLYKADKSFYGYNNYNAKREAAYYIGYQFRLSNKLDSAKILFEMCVKYSQQIDKSETSGFQINSYLYLGMIADELGSRNEAVAYYKKLLDLKEYGNSHSLAEGYLKTPYHR
ncbi:MAG: tetratricopeptide repeat protein [Ignavibacteriaceae bacterium]